MNGKDERKNPTRGEHQLMLHLMILRHMLAQYAPSVRERMRRYPYGWRDIRLLQTLVRKIQIQLLETMPPQREEYYNQYARNGELHVVMKGPIRQDGYVVISDRRLACIAEYAMSSECLMCVKEEREVKRCPLRDALMEVAPPQETPDDRWNHCPYQRIATQLASSEDKIVL